MPAFLTLAYAPDIAAQVAAVAGWRQAATVTHSIGFAVAVSAVVSLASRAWGGEWRRALGLSLFSIVAHDAMDLGQGGDRWFAWPLYTGVVGPSAPWIPRSLVGEVSIFGSLAAILALVHRWQAPATHRRLWTRSRLWGATVAVLMAMSATAVHFVRDRREFQYEEAVRLVAAARPAEALARLDQAAQWPAPSRPGRIEYLRAEAYAGLGDRQRAESLYLAADAIDPRYFWVVADLAAFYAGGDATPAERARLAQPYVERLRRDFATEAALPQMLERVDRLLGSR